MFTEQKLHSLIDEAIWTRAEVHLHRARAVIEPACQLRMRNLSLVENGEFIPTCLARFDSEIQAGHPELAIETLALLGELIPFGGQFWRHLRDAALALRLPEKAVKFDKRQKGIATRDAEFARQWEAAKPILECARDMVKDRMKFLPKVSDEWEQTVARVEQHLAAKSAREVIDALAEFEYSTVVRFKTFLRDAAIAFDLADDAAQFDTRRHIQREVNSLR
ncbi:hypothetical protein AAKU67_002797 [Oxalobacteraceae bacterium GrIS 2.11]